MAARPPGHHIFGFADTELIDIETIEHGLSLDDYLKRASNMPTNCFILMAIIPR
jgi:hypothetical protein